MVIFLIYVFFPKPNIKLFFVVHGPSLFSAKPSGLTTANYTELSHLYEKYKTQGNMYFWLGLLFTGLDIAYGMRDLFSFMIFSWCLALDNHPSAMQIFIPLPVEAIYVNYLSTSGYFSGLVILSQAGPVLNSLVQ